MPALEAPTIPSAPKAEDIDIGGAIRYWDFNVRSWLGPMLIPRTFREEGTGKTDAQETVITSDEISLERMSLTPGRVTIALTDEEARRIKSLDEEVTQHK